MRGLRVLGCSLGVLLGCAAARPQPVSAEHEGAFTTGPTGDGGADDGLDAAVASDAVAGEAGRSPRSSPEVAWLVAHLADDPNPARLGDSDAVRRLVARRSEGVDAAVEVFRVGDARRVPFARRVIEGVALRSCRGDHGRAASRVRWIVTGSLDPSPPDAGIAWSDLLLRWPAERIARVHGWAAGGVPCGADAADAGT